MKLLGTDGSYGDSDDDWEAAFHGLHHVNVGQIDYNTVRNVVMRWLDRTDVDIME